jgi:DNA-binding NtrC family response regulator
MKTKILIIDDEPSICAALAEILSTAAYQTATAGDGHTALELFLNDNFDLILLDLNLPDINGLDLLRRFRQTDANVGIIIASALSDVPTIVKAIREGADNYITKPFTDPEAILAIIERELANKALRDENAFLKSKIDFRSKFPAFLGNTPRIQAIYRLIEKIAQIDTTVLLIGETGTGKELLANAIHQASRRAKQKFISINCGGLPETLLESTLFGYEKGAFTGAYKTTRGIFEEADGGTLFLDEIGETSPALQVRLLRVLQDGTFQRVGGTTTIKTDVRIISATNQDLQLAVKNKTFREDLYYRLNVITIFVPSLRERIDDLPLFVKHFIQRYAEKLHKPVKNIHQQALAYLKAYHWPGNIRELENVIERAVALSDTDTIMPHDLPDHIIQASPLPPPTIGEQSLRQARATFEKQYLENLLSSLNWNISRASQVAGIPRQNLYRKIQQYGLKRPS